MQELAARRPRPDSSLSPAETAVWIATSRTWDSSVTDEIDAVEQLARQVPAVAERQELRQAADAIGRRVAEYERAGSADPGGRDARRCGSALGIAFEGLYGTLARYRD
jgi:hypothetical protein